MVNNWFKTIFPKNTSTENKNGFSTNASTERWAQNGFPEMERFFFEPSNGNPIFLFRKKTKFQKTKPFHLYLNLVVKFQKAKTFFFHSLNFMSKFLETERICVLLLFLFVQKTLFFPFVKSNIFCVFLFFILLMHSPLPFFSFVQTLFAIKIQSLSIP